MASKSFLTGLKGVEYQMSDKERREARWLFGIMCIVFSTSPIWTAWIV